MRAITKVFLVLLGIPLSLFYISQLKKKTLEEEEPPSDTFRENMQRFERFEERMKEHYQNLKTRIGQFFYPSK